MGRVVCGEMDLFGSIGVRILTLWGEVREGEAVCCLKCIRL